MYRIRQGSASESILRSLQPDESISVRNIHPDGVERFHLCLHSRMDKPTKREADRDKGCGVKSIGIPRVGGSVYCSNFAVGDWLNPIVKPSVRLGERVTLLSSVGTSARFSSRLRAVDSRSVHENSMPSNRFPPPG